MLRAFGFASGVAGLPGLPWFEVLTIGHVFIISLFSHCIHHNSYGCYSICMERSEKLSSTIFDLVDKVSDDEITVHNKTAALNSLYLLRDALIDLRYAYSLVRDLSGQRNTLMEQQVDEENFAGDLHEAYHKVSGQLRASTVAIFQLGKRTLNSSSYVLASFLPHGVAVKEGSFGRQYTSVQKLDLTKLDKRSKALVNNLLTNGARLEIHNDARDMYVEHTKPATKARQRRPVHTGAGISFMQEKAEFIGIKERLYSGMVRRADTDFVLLGEKDANGKEVRTYHVHIGHHLVPIDKNIVRSAFLMRPPDYDPDHFKKLEPHSHSFTKTDDDDNIGTAGEDHSIEITELASVDDMISDYCDYIEKMLAVIKRE